MGGLPAGAGLLFWRHWRRAGRALVGAARRLGLGISSPLGFARRASGLVAGHPVVLTHLGRIELDARTTLAADFRLRSRAHPSAGGREAGDVSTGDLEFDARYRVDGNRALALALLTPALRQRIIAIEPHRTLADGTGLPLSHPVEVGDGRVVVDGAGFSDLAEAVRFAVSLAEALRPPVDLVARLVENLHGDRTTWERLVILRLLADRFADHPVGRRALEKALADPNEEARLVAAAALGDEGADTLAHIIGHVSEDETRPAQALRALGERLSTEQLTDLLARALRNRRHLVAEALVELLASRQGESVTARLTAVLAYGTEGLGLAAARALGARGDGAAEPALVAALASSWPSVRVAAAEALGAVGGASAVASLRAAAEGEVREVREAALLAVAQIQSRLPGADFGQLSLADARAGDVSLADEAPRGQVSLAREE